MRLLLQDVRAAGATPSEARAVWQEALIRMSARARASTPERVVDAILSGRRRDRASARARSEDGRGRRRGGRGVRAGRAAPRCRPPSASTCARKCSGGRWRRSRPTVQTIGFAGFFGLPIEVLPLGRHRGGAQCPVSAQARLRGVRGDQGARARPSGRRSRACARCARMRRRRGRPSSNRPCPPSPMSRRRGLLFAGKLVGDSLGRTRRGDASRGARARRVGGEAARALDRVLADRRADRGHHRRAALATAQTVLKGHCR